MHAPELPANERERLIALKEYALLDTASEQEFDEIVSLASFICNTPIATITLIDEHRQWFKSQIGLDKQETPRDVAFCAHAILTNDILVVEDATQDKRFHDNPYVLGRPDIRFYAGMPLTTKDGFSLGTICVIDTKPRELSPEQSTALSVLRNQVLKLFELRRKNLKLDKIQNMHQKLFSIIGHDLRGSVNSIDGLLLLAERYKLSAEDFNEVLPRMRTMVNSTNHLLNNLLHWAKGHIEDGVMEEEVVNIHALIQDVILPLTGLLTEKQNMVHVEVDKTLSMTVNKGILEFIIRNLTLNANKFSDSGTINITISKENSHIRFSISDNGTGIEPERINTIFEWGKSKSTKGTRGEPGSGLGLPMVKEFVEQMAGEINVSSEMNQGTTVTIQLPIHG